MGAAGMGDLEEDATGRFIMPQHQLFRRLLLLLLQQQHVHLVLLLSCSLSSMLTPILFLL
jgi:hypothetical protein